MTLITQSLSVQLITISIISLQRQLVHNDAARRNTWNSTYDYIVVGAGSAGAIVAARLTEDPGTTVLLIEAGGAQTDITDMLANAWIGMLGENDWGYQTTPQRRAGFAFADRRIVYPRGRVLGGSSTTNYAIYNRGNRRDFDNWANNYGATGWSYADVLPYFRRMENQTNPKYALDRDYHSTTGQMPIASAPRPDPILLKYMQAWGREGWPTIDFNGETQRGTTLIQQAVSPTNWTRSSTASAFIEPAIKTRNNLHVICQSLVTRVLLANTTNGLTATGVEFIKNNTTYTVSAGREVIMSAGATNTPQVLMLSGIGPRSHLEDMGIQVQADLPVGNNLMDHILIPMDYLVQNESLIQWSRNLDSIMTVQNLYDYYVNNDGPLIQLPTVLTYHSSRFNDNPDWPDGIRATLTSQIGNISDVMGMYGQNIDEWADYWNGLSGDQRHFWIFYAVYRPRSRGTLRLASTDPKDAPLIDPNYFAENYDLGVVVDVMSTGMRMTEQPFFRKYARIYNRTIPGCRMCDSGNYWECYSYLACVAQTITATSYHPVGTCRMGSANDTDAVVDNQLRVRGVNSLRVIDASIMPKIINANTNAASMMIGERGSDWVRYGQ